MLTKKKTAILALILIASVAIAFAGGYYLGQIVGHVVVKEPITWTPTEFTVELFAGETKTQDITVSNAANVDLNVTVDVTVDSPENIEATAPPYITVPAGASATLTITIHAFDWAEPTTEESIYTVFINLSR